MIYMIRVVGGITHKSIGIAFNFFGKFNVNVLVPLLSDNPIILLSDKLLLIDP